MDLQLDNECAFEAGSWQIIHVKFNIAINRIVDIINLDIFYVTMKPYVGYILKINFYNQNAIIAFGEKDVVRPIVASTLNIAL